MTKCQIYTYLYKFLLNASMQVINHSFSLSFQAILSLCSFMNKFINTLASIPCIEQYSYF
jgi:hypothetical protein